MKTLLLTLLVATIAQAHEFKTKDFCSTTTKDMCAHIGYDAKPETKKAFVFTFDIINKVKAKDVKDVVINVVAKSADGKTEYIPTTWTMRPDGHHWDATAKTATAATVTGVQGKYKYQGKEEEIIVELK